MNEELRIIIKAKTDEAKKKIGEVRKELDNMSASNSENKKRFTEAMGALAKGAAVAMAAVAGLTAAMTKLAHSATDVNKGFAKLNTTFNSLGSTTAQATKTYKELFSFLGEHDKAIETAQSLALITTEEKKLAECIQIFCHHVTGTGSVLHTVLGISRGPEIKTFMMLGGHGRKTAACTLCDLRPLAAIQFCGIPVFFIERISSGNLVIVFMVDLPVLNLMVVELYGGTVEMNKGAKTQIDKFLLIFNKSVHKYLLPQQRDRIFFYTYFTQFFLLLSM